MGVAKRRDVSEANSGVRDAVKDSAALEQSSANMEGPRPSELPATSSPK